MYRLSLDYSQVRNWKNRNEKKIEILAICLTARSISKDRCQKYTQRRFVEIDDIVNWFDNDVITGAIDSGLVTCLLA